MHGRALACDTCSRALAEDAARRSELVTCACGERYRYLTFPAAFAADTAREAPARRAPEQASCYFHDHHAPVESCARCGRLLCEVCDLRTGQQHFCGVCLADEPFARTHRGRACELWMHDSVTLLVALVPPVAFWPLTPLCASYALYRCSKYWREPAGLCPRGRTLLIVALFVALLELVALAALIALLVLWRFE